MTNQHPSPSPRLSYIQEMALSPTLATLTMIIKSDGYCLQVNVDKLNITSPTTGGCALCKQFERGLGKPVPAGTYTVHMDEVNGVHITEAPENNRKLNRKERAELRKQCAVQFASIRQELIKQLETWNKAMSRKPLEMARPRMHQALQWHLAMGTDPEDLLHMIKNGELLNARCQTQEEASRASAAFMDRHMFDEDFMTRHPFEVTVMINSDNPWEIVTPALHHEFLSQYGVREFVFVAAFDGCLARAFCRALEEYVNTWLKSSVPAALMAMIQNRISRDQFLLEGLNRHMTPAQPEPPAEKPIEDAGDADGQADQVQPSVPDGMFEQVDTGSDEDTSDEDLSPATELTPEESGLPAEPPVPENTEVQPEDGGAPDTDSEEPAEE